MVIDATNQLVCFQKNENVAQLNERELNMLPINWCFYRPGEAEKKGVGNWKSCDTREIYYSFHRDEVPAESVMHKSVVYFAPLNKQFPKRKQHPGFIVQKAYDPLERKLWKLTDKDFEDVQQQEIDELVQKTQKRIDELLDIEPEEAPPADQEKVMKNKRSSRRKSISPIDVSREEERISKSDQHSKPETPMSFVSNNSEHHRILVNFNALTGNINRDKWLERLLQHIRCGCNYDEGVEKGNGSGNADYDEIKNNNNDKTSETAKDCQDKGQKSSKSFVWPDAAVSAIISFEKASNEAFSTEFQKYNQKLRQLDFNLKNNALLARRLLNGELEPSKILNMTPIELIAEELTKKEPDVKQHMQMTDARCSRCTEFKVGFREIIHVGHNDNYQLECVACGNSWYAFRDEVSTLTIDALDSKRTTGTTPSATAKFEDVQKKLGSPCESENTADGICKKAGEPQTLEHLWMREGGEAFAKLINSVVLSIMKQFRAMNNFKKLSLKVMAENISEEEIKGLKAMVMLFLVFAVGKTALCGNSEAPTSAVPVNVCEKVDFSNSEVCVASDNLLFKQWNPGTISPLSYLFSNLEDKVQVNPAAMIEG
ncbi:uncharacterized protein LOC131605248 [Vicia villosa]|uniref:uncharacterized protein LOC131605248 n=1 Tax=Vicia villosa TaxID=3911 RepID=UPI00273CB0C4|nr:uncharacterized protein LOC131605248 [Vicia villosa]